MKKSMFTKIFCLVLSVAIIALSIPFTAIAATASSAKFAVVSDIHYFAEAGMGSDKAKFEEFCKLNNSTTYLAPSIVDTVLANLTIKALAGEIEFLLVPGDLTRNAEYSAHVELANKLEKFEQMTGVPVYVINGNHDINNDRAAKYDGTNFVADTDTNPEEFEAIYAELGYNEALSRYIPAEGDYEGYLSYTANLGDDYRLIAIDSQKYSADNTDSGLDEQETAGSVSDKLREWVIAETKKAKAEGREVIGMIHTNIVPHFETEVDLFDNFVLREWDKFADRVADAGMNYVFSGHVHMSDVASYVSDNGETIYDLSTTSVLSYPNQFRTCEITNYSNGTSDLSYKSHDCDELTPVVFNNQAMSQPMKYETWAVNFGGDNIRNFALNFIEYQLLYGFGKDIEEAGGLTAFVSDAIGLDTIVAGMIDNETLGGALGSVSSFALEALLASILNQIDKTYLQDIDYTMSVLAPMIDELLAIEVSDIPSTKFKSTLGFGSTGEKGTLGDMASSVLAYHYTNDEYPYDDEFFMDALDRFYNGENAEVIVDTLLTVVVDDLLQDEILGTIKIDPISAGINGVAGDVVAGLVDTVGGLLGTSSDDWTGVGVSDLIGVILISGVVGGDTLSQVIYAALDEYLTQSQYDVIDGEFYRILKDLSHDENPKVLMDLNGKISYTGKVAVPISQDNFRLPSHIAVTFGDDSATTRNISYFTKYSITDTDIQIVPYSENPDFSKGTTVDATIDTNCEVDAIREYSAINLSFIGIISHQTKVNRHTIAISGLEAGEKYCYRIGDADRGWWSEIGVIDTADNSTEFSFFHMTDPQSVTEKQYAENWAVVLDTAFTNHSDSDFILSTGDLVDNGDDFVEWGRMFNSSEWLLDTALMSASGNHEERGDNALVNNFYYTTLPEQDTTTGVYYSFDYNTAHVAVLNTNDLNDENGLSDAQIQWLTEDMNASNKAWKFVALHKAPYSNGSHFDDDDVAAIRAQLQTLMPELDIDIVFQGHDHVYMRTDVLNNNAIVETEEKSIKYNGLEYVSKISPEGTIYSINGTAGCKHYVAKSDDEIGDTFPKGEAVVELDIPSYSYIQIDGGILYFDSYEVEADGSENRIDNFAISKVVTLEDGTVIDGTDGNKVTEAPKTENVPGDIAKTFSENPVYSYVAYAVVALVIMAGIVTTVVIVKRKREEA